MKTILPFVLSILLLACSNANFGNREKGALIGGTLGAGLGAIVGHKTGSAGAGTAIGAGIGALSGGLIGNSMDKQEDRLSQQDQRIHDQQRQIDENKRLIQELKRRGLDVTENRKGVVVNLPDVLFEFNKAALTSEAVGTVQEISDVVRGYPERRISVEGHTDSIGTMSYNKKLSEDRARSVADELVAQGVSRRRVTTVGYGEADPIASNRTEGGRSRNRRVEVIIK